MLRERILPKPEVIRAIVLEDSPCSGGSPHGVVPAVGELLSPVGDDLAPGLDRLRRLLVEDQLEVAFDRHLI